MRCNYETWELTKSHVEKLSYTQFTPTLTCIVKFFGLSGTYCLISISLSIYLSLSLSLYLSLSLSLYLSHSV